MERSEKALIIIPAYNEERGILGVIQEVKKVDLGLNVVVVNDGSTDNTVAKTAGAEVLNLPFNMGYGVALQTGYKYALENDYDYLIQLDGDGQHDPKYIVDLLVELNKGEADLIIGSRFLGNKVYRVPALRRLVMLFFGSVASLLIGQKITDPTSGYRGMNKEVIRFLVKDLYPEDYPDADIIVMLHRFGFHIKEIPVTMYPNVKDKTMHSGLKPFYYVFKMVLSIFLTLMRK
jgi:glycosyltransferase involved in cell wall biosynthesis